MFPETRLVLIVSLVVACLLPLLGDRYFRLVEEKFTKFAERRTAAVVVVFFGTIVVRLALLLKIPVPVPFVHDEFAYLVQADMFAHGHLAYPAHPMARYLETFYVTFTPTYSSMYPPAQAAVLAFGQLLGHPWIGVLLSSAAMCAAILWMLQAWIPAQWALLGTILFTLRIGILSYWMNSYWGGAVAAAAAALVLGALPRIMMQQRWRDALLMGIGAFVLENSRPLEGAILCVPVAAMMIAWLVKRRRSGVKLPVRTVMSPIAALLALTVGFTLYYNWRVTTNPFVVPHAIYIKEYMSVLPFMWMKPLPLKNFSNPQFHAFFDGWVPQQYNSTWADAKQITLSKFWEFRHFFLGWYLCLPLLAIPWVVRDRRVRFLLIEVVICGAGLLAVVWFLPHYAAPMIPVFLAVLMQCLRHMKQWKIRGYAIGAAMCRVIVLLALAVSVRDFRYAIHYPFEQPLFDHWQPHNWPRAEITEELQKEPGEHLVLVRYPANHDIHMEWVYNAADIDHAKIVWAREMPGVDLGPLLNYYRNRKVWEVETDSDDVPVYPYVATKTTGAESASKLVDSKGGNAQE